MTYQQFITLRSQEEVSLGIDRYTALRLVDQLPLRYRAAHYFWSWVWLISLGVFCYVLLFVKWWIGAIGLFFIAPSIRVATIKSATQFVLEHAQENERLFNLLNSMDVLRFKLSTKSEAEQANGIRTAPGETQHGETIESILDALRDVPLRSIVVEILSSCKGQVQSLVLHFEKGIPDQEKSMVLSTIRQMEQACSNKDFWKIGVDEYTFLLQPAFREKNGMSSLDSGTAAVAFYLATTRLAERALLDLEFRRHLRIRKKVNKANPEKELQAASDALLIEKIVQQRDRGEISSEVMTKMFQTAIDNGDVLLEENAVFVIGIILPLIDRGVLQASSHISAFESQMKQKCQEFLLKRAAG